MTVKTAGDLRERVAFDKRMDYDDGFGNTVSDFVEQFQTWARITPLVGQEAVQAARLEGTQTVVITVRDYADTHKIGSDWQVRNTLDGVVYAVKGPPINRDERHGFFDILAQTGVAT